jgi:hypothetical protein
VFGGSLWTLPYLGQGTFGTPTERLHSSGENNYYPSYSPDGSFIAFNQVPQQGSGALDACASGLCPNDSYSNPKARVFVLGAASGNAIDCERANGSPSTMPVDVSNSWPRWSPFIQKYKGAQILWLTFSSTRDYGLRVRNHTLVNGQQQVQCYPAVTPENPSYQVGSFPPNCQQPQLWMTAINLNTAGKGTDPSFPAFWLPFQDITAHNHTAQWTSTVVNKPPPDGGTCIPAGQDCAAAPDNCCGSLVCDAQGVCSEVIK